MSLEHVCGLEGYCPGYPHYDPRCPACAAADRFDESKQPAAKSRVELEAEIVALRAERDKWLEQSARVTAALNDATTEIATLTRYTIPRLEAERDRLRAALLRYGQHEAGCPAIADDESDQVLYDYGQCACGFATACPEEP